MGTHAEMALPTLPAPALIEAAQGGDPAALAALLKTCQADARRYARRHCHASDVDDAVQESLLTLSRRLGALRAVAAFSSWLFVLVQRQCLRLGRQLRRHAPLEEAQAEQALAGRRDEDLRLDLVRALESLPAHYREVVLLRDFEDLTIAEIAARLDEPAGAVKSRLHRARLLVREYLLSP